MRKVVLIHDAAIDEYVSFLLLTAMQDVDLAGSVIVNADCIGGPAMQTQWRIQSYIGRQDIPLALSGVRGENPFPWAYRSDCVTLGRIPPLQPYGSQPDWPPYPDGDRWLRDFFAGLDEQVTLVCLCPLTPLELLFENEPSAPEKIAEMIWMGGAIDVGGNLDPTTLAPGFANPYAEWNVYWDPAGTQRVLSSTTFPITLFPLDITDSAKLSADFLQQLLVDGKSHPVSDLARQAYGLVSAEPFYSMWDVTATVFLAHPELYAAPEQITVSVDTSENKTGALVRDPGGRAVNFVPAFADLPGFYSYVTGSLRSMESAA